MISRYFFVLTFDTYRGVLFFTRVANFCRKVLSREESMVVEAMAQPQMTVIPREQHAISRKDISENALKVLYRLNKAGYDAYTGWAAACVTYCWAKNQRILTLPPARPPDQCT